MGIRKSHIISLNKLCQEVGIGYQGIWKNLKLGVRPDSWETNKQIIFDRLDRAVEEFKDKFK